MDRTSARTPPPATLDAKVAALQTPSAYPDRPPVIEAVQTHFAWVFLTGSHAYKLKKPIRMKGADLRSLAARKQNCSDEIRVNSRLSPEVYVRVAPLSADPEGLTLDGSGRTEDWLVVMRQLPRERMLDRLLEAGRVGLADLERLVGKLVDFYRRLPAEPLAPEAYVRSVRARVAEAIDELRRPEFGLPEGALTAARADLEAACGRLEPALARRASTGRIVEAHGDLRAEHVCLGPPVAVIDALEFDRDLRVLDTAEEIAMLVVDVTRLGGRDVAVALRAEYLRAMPDDIDPGLFGFYAALRAITRAKVSIWHLDDAGQYPDAAPWRRRALEFIDLARRFGAGTG